MRVAAGAKAVRKAEQTKADVGAAELALQHAVAKYGADDPRWQELAAQLEAAEAAVLQKAEVQLECLAVTARGSSWVLQLPGAHTLGGGQADTLAMRYALGDAPVWIDWPYCTEGRVVCVTTPSERCWRDRRGKLGRWGANHAVDLLLTRDHPVTGELQIVVVKRDDRRTVGAAGGGDESAREPGGEACR